MKIDEADVEAYFLSKFKNHNCPFCQACDWTIATYENGGVVLSQTMDIEELSNLNVIRGGTYDDTPAESREEVSTLAVISLRCANCNWVAHFDYQEIEKELRNGKK